MDIEDKVIAAIQELEDRWTIYDEGTRVYGNTSNGEKYREASDAMMEAIHIVYKHLLSK